MYLRIHIVHIRSVYKICKPMRQPSVALLATSLLAKATALLVLFTPVPHGR